MNDFYKASETKREGDISHYGIKGMKWGYRMAELQGRDDQGRLVYSKVHTDIDIPNPKRANKEAVQHARDAMAAYGFQNPETPGLIAKMDYDSFRNLLYTKKMKELPDNAGEEDLKKAFKDSLNDSGVIYLCSKVIAEAEKREAKEAKKAAKKEAKKEANNDPRKKELDKELKKNARKESLGMIGTLLGAGLF